MEKEKETKRDYESPSTEKTTVEMQGYLCGSIKADTEEKGVNVKSQDVIQATKPTEQNGYQGNDFSEKEWGTF